MERICLHYAQPADAERLTSSGFDAPGRTVQAWAAGVYLATDRTSGTLYDDGQRIGLIVKAEVERPFLIHVPEQATTIFAVIADAVRDAFGDEAAERVSVERLRRERIGLAGELTTLLIEHGFDALEVQLAWTPDRSDTRSIHFGGNQLVVFNADHVRVALIDVGAPLLQPNEAVLESDFEAGNLAADTFELLG